MITKLFASYLLINNRNAFGCVKYRNISFYHSSPPSLFGLLFLSFFLARLALKTKTIISTALTYNIRFLNKFNEIRVHCDTIQCNYVISIHRRPSRHCSERECKDKLRISAYRRDNIQSFINDMPMNS